MSARNQPAFTSARGSRAGLVWQDVYAAWMMVKAWAQPGEGIRVVEAEVENLAPIDDVVVTYADRVEFLQLKHTVRDRAPLTAAMLFGASDGAPLVARVFRRWRELRLKGPNRVLVRVVRNAPCSASPTNHPISPAALADEILRPAAAGEDERVTGHPVFEALVATLGAPDQATALEFLRCFEIWPDQPDIDELLDRMVDRLREFAQCSDETARRRVKALVGNVALLAARPGQSRPLDPHAIGRELGMTLPGVRDHSRHLLQLPPRHVPRTRLAGKIRERALALGQGYLFVLGPPGCGKTTLATWLAESWPPDRPVLRYHAFDPRERTQGERVSRVTEESFIRDLLLALHRRFPDRVPMRRPSEGTVGEARSTLLEELERLGRSSGVTLLLDGIDHVVRARPANASDLFAALPPSLPPGVVVVAFGQPNWSYPPWMRRLFASFVEEVPPFDEPQSRLLTCQSLGWDTNEPAARAVATRLHRVSGGNPLSLIYNLMSIDSTQGPSEVAEALESERLIGKDPEVSYELLLGDIEAALDRAVPLIREQLLAYLATSASAVSEERLMKGWGSLDRAQATGIVDRLRPVLARCAHGWLPVHDDLRRYARGLCEPRHLRQAHRRHAQGLRETWRGEEIAARAEHLWEGGNHEELAWLPEEHSLADWLELASHDALARAFRLSLAASFAVGVVPSMVRNALHFERLLEVSPDDQDEIGEPLALDAWTFRVPPASETPGELRLRASALSAAARGFTSDPGVAREIARRFHLSDEALKVLDGDVDAAQYVRAYVDLAFAAGQPHKVVRLLSVNQRLGSHAIPRVASQLGSTSAVDQLAQLIESLRPWAGTLAPWLAEAASSQLFQGRREAANRLVAALPADADLLDDEGVREAAVLRCILGDRTALDALEPHLCGNWEPSDGLLAASRWRHAYFAGYVAGWKLPVPDISMARTPEWRGVGARSNDDRLLFETLWRAGASSALTSRVPGAVRPAELEPVFRGMVMGWHADLRPHGRFLFRTVAALHLPMVAASLEARPEAVAVLSRLLQQAIEAQPQRCDDLGVARWNTWRLLDSPAWAGAAERARQATRLPGSNSWDRVTWFRFWREQDPGEAERPGLGRVAALGVSHKSDDPAQLVVDMLLVLHRADRLSAEHVGEAWRSLMRLNGEDEGDRCARRHLPTILGLTLATSPTEFNNRYRRSIEEYEIDDWDGSAAADVALSLLSLAPSNQFGVAVWAALWAWVSACPGAWERHGSGPEAAAALQARLTALGRDQMAAEVETWTEALTARHARPSDQEGETGPPQVLDDHTAVIDEAELGWLSPYFGGVKHQRLKAYLAAHGAAGRAKLLKVLAGRLAGALGSSPARVPHRLAELLTDSLELSVEDAVATLGIAQHHLDEKVQFQAPVDVEPGGSSSGAAASIIQCVTTLLRSSDASTVRGAIRSIRWLLTQDETADEVRDAVRRFLGADTDESLELLARLAVGPSLGGSALADEGSPNGWVRALSGGSRQPPDAPQVLPLRAPVALHTQERNVAGRSYIHTDAGVRQHYIERFEALAGLPEEVIRDLFDAAAQYRPTATSRLPWSGRRSGLRISDGIESCLAARVVDALHELVPESVVPVLLAACASGDPWLASCPPVVPPPAGWKELGASVETFDEGGARYEIRTLATAAAGTRAQLEDGGDSSAAEACLFPEAPECYAWVAHPWPAVAPPRPRAGQFAAMCFRNRPFPAVERAYFYLVPWWTHFVLHGLTLRVAGSLSWVDAEGVPRVVATYREWRDEQGYRSQLPAVSWETSWYIDPGFLLERLGGAELVLLRHRRHHQTEGGLESAFDILFD